MHNGNGYGKVENALGMRESKVIRHDYIVRFVPSCNLDQIRRSITPHNPHFIIDTKIFAITTPYIRPNRPITLFS